MASYMNAEAVVELLSKSRKWGEKWVGTCPAHDDKSPSLTVSNGKKGTLLYCFAGCTTESVCEALGIPIAKLFKDYERGGNGNHDAQLALQERLRLKQPPTMRELGPALSLEDVLWPVIVATPPVWTWVRIRWGDWLAMPFKEAMQKHWVVTDALCADLMVNELDAGYDYTLAEKRRLKERLEEEWETNGPILSR